MRKHDPRSLTIKLFFHLNYIVMARIKYSALVSDMRNKLNGSVMSANRAGSYIRNKVTPVNPRTQYQQAQRQLLGSLSSAWRGLSEAERASWRAATESFPYTDIFGDQKKLDGKSLFIKLNLNLASVNEDSIDSAPLPAGVPILAVSGVSATVDAVDSSTTISFATNVETAPTGFKLLVFATPPIAPGRSFVKNQFRKIGVGTITSNEVLASSQYTSRLGGLTSGDIGKTVHIRAAFVNEATGEMGVPVGASAVITSS